MASQPPMFLTIPNPNSVSTLHLLALTEYRSSPEEKSFNQIAVQLWDEKQAAVVLSV